MATLVLSVVGTAVAGPFGQAFGALVGNQIDRAVFGGGSRDGPRLKELSVTTSSYGRPIARIFGRMRIAGSVVWATDIRESSERQGGGKGQPSSTTYSYSASFAVALSSTPLARIGRIWADGNLLRGAQGDLKVEGIMRAYLGTGNDPVDPLIEADKGSEAPAFRDYAYVVFEDLSLADFGNRIPALTFEVFGQDEDSVSLARLAPQAMTDPDSGTIAHARGFADEGGPIGGSLAAIDTVQPLICVTTAEGIRIEPRSNPQDVPAALPERLAIPNSNEGAERHRKRSDQSNTAPLALRYYDEERDYQPGVQRAVGMRPNGRENMIDLPATMTANGARQLANDNAQRSRWQAEHLIWKIGVLDPDIGPGSIVTIPDQSGAWRVESWEWFDRGIELALERVPVGTGSTIATESGAIVGAADLSAPPTVLRFIEAPGDGSLPGASPVRFAAASASNSAWRGAALFAELAETLVPIGSVSAGRAVLGNLVQPLGPSDALLLEPKADILVQVIADDLGFSATSIAGLAVRANRLLIGSEVIQFLDAEFVGERIWRLNGLLRGRAGTEDFAAQGHDIGQNAILLDERLTLLDPTIFAVQTATKIAAIGRGDDDATYADLENQGLSHRPPAPVHPRLVTTVDGTWHLCWTRRARGAWVWQDGVEAPLVEENESYTVGFGPTNPPFGTWQRTEPAISLTAQERSDLLAQFGPGQFWVRQNGTFSVSSPLLLANLS